MIICRIGVLPVIRENYLRESLNLGNRELGRKIHLAMEKGAVCGIRIELKRFSY